MRILSVNTKGGFFGGIENTLYRMALLFQEQGWENIGLFETETDQTSAFYTPFRQVWLMDDISLYDLRQKIKDVDVVIVHKITQPRLFDYLLDHYPVIVMVHDHDYYCPRKYKYFPFIHTDCKRPFHPVYCSLCSGMLNRGEGKIPFKPISVFKNYRMLSRLKKAYRVVILSEFMRQNLILNQIPPNRILKIHPFIEQQKVLPNKKKGLTELLFIGQIIPAKGVDLLVEMMPFLRNACHLTIVGAGIQIPQISKLIEKYELKSVITLAGWVKDPGEYYKKADIVILPSRWQEPFGLAGVEAFSYGIPVVASDVGGIHEWLIDSSNGVRVPANDVKALASAVDTLIDQPDLLRQFGQNGRDSVGKIYSKEKFLEQFKIILEGINA
jgi:glycosyltransferase involved in cell wall biosynthesis